MEGELSRKSAALRRIVAELGRVGVAYSGGVDSTLLLAVCRSVLGRERVLALTAHSALLPAPERQSAAEMAARLDVLHRVVEFDVWREPDITANRADRCYYCKRAVFGRLLETARAAGFPLLVHGANLDDLGDYRPGARAAEELGVRAPLLEAGFRKADVRALSRELGLPTWDLPAMACLASRIPYGTPLTAAALARVEAAEEFVRARFTLPQVRVRDHFPIARIEAPADNLSALVQPDARVALVRRLRDLGYRYVTLDLEGFRSGSMNELLG